MVRIVSWNIRAGGGQRATGIAEAIVSLSPDIAVLQEFRGTPPSEALKANLVAAGLVHTWSTASSAVPAANATLIASRLPGRRVTLRSRADEPLRWSAVEVVGLRLLGVHVPNEHTGRKWPFLESLLGVARSWRRHEALIIGDTNSGRPGIDEESAVFGPRYTAWFDRLEALGWRDSFRHLHAGRREFTWYSPNGGNGFRLDEAFVSPRLAPGTRHVEHRWMARPGRPARRDGLSDHAALVVDIDLLQRTGITSEGSDPGHG
ncbi:MAG: endonuclease/exonuclease/phosphatase family protein [Dehalococcoidia bacterium]